MYGKGQSKSLLIDRSIDRSELNRWFRLLEDVLSDEMRSMFRSLSYLVTLNIQSCWCEWLIGGSDCPGRDFSVSDVLSGLADLHYSRGLIDRGTNGGLDRIHM